MNRHRNTAPLVVGILLAALAAGCSASSEDGDSPPELGEIPAVDSSTALPLDAYALSASEQAELRQGYVVLLQRCAQRFGATAQTVNVQTARLEADSRMWGGRLGTMSMEHASSLGYHAGPDDPVVPSFSLFANDGTEPLDTVLHGVGTNVDPAAPTVEVEGLPEGGCIGAVTRDLGGDPMALVPEEVEAMRLKAFRDARTKKAIAAWRSCMADAGFTYTTVDDPVDEFGDGRPVSAEEVAVARTDVTCTRSSRWRDISFAIEKAYQERALAEDPEKWDTVRTRARDVLDRARKLAVAS